jgi:hypothetical protein
VKTHGWTILAGIDSCYDMRLWLGLVLARSILGHDLTYIRSICAGASAAL